MCYPWGRALVRSRIHAWHSNVFSQTITPITAGWICEEPPGYQHTHTCPLYTGEPAGHRPASAHLHACLRLLFLCISVYSIPIHNPLLPCPHSSCWSLSASLCLCFAPTVTLRGSTWKPKTLRTYFNDTFYVNCWVRVFISSSGNA